MRHLLPSKKGLWREMELNASELFISEECFQNVFRYYAYSWYVPITWQGSSIGGNQLLLFADNG